MGNISGCNVEHGDVIAKYFGSGPPKYTGSHRYVFLLYKHVEKVDFGNPRVTRKDRIRFSVEKFGEQYKLGSPVAGNFYVSQWDHSVSCNIM